MTEKRFEVTFNDSDFHLKDNETGEELKLVDEKVCYDYIADRWNAFHEENEQLKEENQALKNELNGMEQLLQSYRKTIKHDAELLADATKNGYLPPLEDWRELE